MEQSQGSQGRHSDLERQVYVIGVEIGGRGQRVAVADASGTILGAAHSIDGSASAYESLNIVKALADQACFQAGIAVNEVSQVGVAFGGPVDPQRGVTLLSHRAFGFENFPLVILIEEQLGIPAVLDNGARAAALGETMFGMERGSGDLVYLHLSTGVGAGVIVDGRLLHGASSTAGEIGHMVVSSGGPICSCGKPGHLEAYAAAPSIVARFFDRLRDANPEDLERWSNRSNISVPTIFGAAKAGDRIASEIVNETVQVLGIAISNLITTLNPAAVIIGGAVSEVKTLLIEPLTARVRQYAYPASARRVRLSITQHGPDATVIGAVALALTSLDD